MGNRPYSYKQMLAKSIVTYIQKEATKYRDFPVVPQWQKSYKSYKKFLWQLR